MFISPCVVDNYESYICNSLNLYCDADEILNISLGNGNRRCRHIRDCEITLSDSTMNHTIAYSVIIYTL